MKLNQILTALQTLQTTADKILIEAQNAANPDLPPEVESAFITLGSSLADIDAALPDIPVGTTNASL